MSNWTLFSNHGHVLVCLARDAEARLRDVAADVGITERAVQKIVRDLQDGDMVSVTKNGRRNQYRIHYKQSLRHELEADCSLGDLIKVVNKRSAPDQFAAKRLRQADKPSPQKSAVPDTTVKPQAVIVKKTKAIRPKAVEIETEKSESSGSDVADNKERQQGLLF